MHSCPMCDEICDCDMDDTWGLPVPDDCPHVCAEPEEFQDDYEDYEEGGIDCGHEAEVDTPFNYLPCPKCHDGTFALASYKPEPDWKARAEVLEKENLNYAKIFDLQKARIERLEDALQKIYNWSQAYPLDVFPEPDLQLARKLLTDGGVSYDALNAHAMRHVIKGVETIVTVALLPAGGA